MNASLNRVLRWVLLTVLSGGATWPVHAKIELVLIPTVLRTGNITVIENQGDASAGPMKREPALSPAFTLIVNCLIRNDGPNEETVVTGVGSSSGPEGGSALFTRSFSVESVNGQLIKPSLTKMAPVTLKPGEEASLPKVTIDFSRSNELTNEIKVLYSIDPELRRFYDCWIGDLVAVVNIDSLRTLKIMQHQ
jgi:hypothetical protein